MQTPIMAEVSTFRVTALALIAQCDTDAFGGGSDEAKVTWTAGPGPCGPRCARVPG